MKRIIAAIAITTSTMAHAYFIDGNKLLSYMQHESVTWQMLALGYVQGVADMGSGVVTCAPPNITAGQLNDMMKIWLVNNPAERHRSADILITYVLTKAWPCPKRPKSGGDV